MLLRFSNLIFKNRKPIHNLGVEPKSGEFHKKLMTCLFGDQVYGSLPVLKELVYKGLKGTEENVIGSLKKGKFYL